MRGISYILLCSSALALCSGALAQEGIPPAVTASPDSEVQQLRDEIRRLKGVMDSLETRLQRLETGSPPSTQAAEAEIAPQQAAVADPGIEVARTGEICRIDGGATARILEKPNDFQTECLGLNEASDFETLGLASQLTGNLSSSSIEIVGSYTRHSRPVPATVGDSFRTSYQRLQLGARSKVQDGTPVEFADLSRLGLTRGLVGFGELEFGWHRKQSRAAFQAAVAKGLQAARRACIDYYAQRPQSDPLSGSSPEQSVRLHASGEIASLCSGANLSSWMGDKKAPDVRTREERRGFLTGIVGPLWGYDAFPEWFVGLRGEYAEPTFTYYPLYDPLQPGVPLLAALPALATEDKERTNWSMGIYGGHGPSESLRLEGSLTYQEQHAFPKGFTDVTICQPVGATTFSQCTKANTAAPFKTEGFVLGGRGKAMTPQRWLLPPLGFDLKLTYALDTDQFGFDFPIYFATDKDGKLNAGIRIAVTSDGRADNGLKLEGDAKAFFFVGTSFQTHPK
jgi:hypothetical protein